MSSKRDYYEVLSVDRKATGQDIKSQFRKLARKYHPDVNPGDKSAEEKFKELNEAYQVLSDPQRRSQYDQLGHSAFSGVDFNNASGFKYDDLFSGFGFDDIFDAFGFGGRQRRTTRRRGPAPGSDLRFNLTISLKDAYTGLSKGLEFNVKKSCAVCQGTGAEKGGLETCSECKGAGQVRRVQSMGFARFVNVTTCPRCRGRGKSIKKLCPECRGEGRTLETKRVEVKIPPGVNNGSILRLSREGEDGPNGGAPGDLYIVIHVEPHDIFDRDEDNLYGKTIVDITTAVLGGKINIPTMTEEVILKVPPGTQSHTIFRIKGKGMPRIRGRGHGDLMIRLVVEIPVKLSKKKKTDLKTLFPNTPHSTTIRGFFDRLTEQKV